ncbi:MAG: PAS domain-containing protein [Asticcacaulis sp.]
MTGQMAAMMAAIKAHETLFRYWRSLRQEGRLPSRAQLDPSAFRNLLPQISLVDVSGDPLDPVCLKQRLAGTGFYPAYGREITGRTFAEIYPPAASAYWCEELAFVVRTQKPSVGLHNMAWRGLPGLSLFWLRLPLSTDGKNVDVILGHDAFIGELRLPNSGIRAA